MIFTIIPGCSTPASTLMHAVLTPRYWMAGKSYIFLSTTRDAQSVFPFRKSLSKQALAPFCAIKCSQRPPPKEVSLAERTHSFVFPGQPTGWELYPVQLLSPSRCNPSQQCTALFSFGSIAWYAPYFLFTLTTSALILRAGRISQYVIVSSLFLDGFSSNFSSGTLYLPFVFLYCPQGRVGLFSAIN